MPRSVRFGMAAAILLLIAMLCQTGTALAEKRVALIIGNSNYKNVTALTNPVNDAAAITALLKQVGFDVVDTRRDIGIGEMRRAIRDFSDRTRDADVAIVYFAGHGIEVDGINYLIPVDAMMERDIDVEDETLSLDRVLRVLDSVKHLRLVILDACRDNPFAKTMKRTLAMRSIGRGLAKIEPAMSNTLIAFAAKAGSTAADGDGANSPFTTALLSHIAEPGLDLRLAFGRVRDDVLQRTANRQEPFVYGSLGGSNVSLLPAAPVAVAAPTPPDPAAQVRRDYEFAAQIGTRAAWDSFLSAHAAGFYADLARAARAKLIDAEKAALEASATQARLEAEKAAAASAEAGRRRAEAERAELVRAEAARAEAARADAARAEAARAEAARAEAAKLKVAAVAPDPAAEALETARALQTQLQLVGCYSGSVDGNWDAASRRALENFNRHSGAKLNASTASAEAIDAVRSRTSRVCPLVCGHGSKPEGESCVAIVCGPGMILGDDGKSCEKKPSKPAKAAAPSKTKQGGNETAARPAARSGGGDSATRSGGGGTRDMVVCDRTTCRSVKTARPNADGSLPAGCHRTSGSTARGNANSGAIVCN